MESTVYVKNIERAAPITLSSQIDYEQGSVISLSLVQRENLAMTLFAISQGEGIGGHASTGDAMVNILEGCAEITIGGKINLVSAGETILMPANIDHALHAKENFKMLLTVVKP